MSKGGQDGFVEVVENGSLEVVESGFFGSNKKQQLLDENHSRQKINTFQKNVDSIGRTEKRRGVPRTRKNRSSLPLTIHCDDRVQSIRTIAACSS